MGSSLSLLPLPLPAPPPAGRGQGGGRGGGAGHLVVGSLTGTAPDPFSPTASQESVPRHQSVQPW
jgi:hypothetical protein